MNRAFSFIFLFALVCSTNASYLPPSNDFDAFIERFITDYQTLEIPLYRLSYVDNLQQIQSNKGIFRQEQCFQHYSQLLAVVDRNQLSAAQKIEYDVLAYELKLQSLRIGLEKKWREEKRDTFSHQGLQYVKGGKEWYRYFLKRWIDISVEPDFLYTFGLQEIDRVEKAMQTIQKRSGYDSMAFQTYLGDTSFFFNQVEDVQTAFKSLDEHLKRTLTAYFPKLEKIPPLQIAVGNNPRLSQVPGYYTNTSQGGTFYFNFFNSSFNKRQIGWLYVHEGIPGHHYERSYTRMLSKPSKLVQQAPFNYSAYIEGWAAYIEDIGVEIGAYRNDYEAYGKWEWDLIRSLRICMDIGLNYYDWTDQKALKFWQKHIANQDAIGKREIARMRRWPAQVITYKYGAKKMLSWQKQAYARKDFDWVRFHEEVLQYGPLPLSILENLLPLQK